MYYVEKFWTENYSKSAQYSTIHWPPSGGQYIALSVYKLPLKYLRSNLYRSWDIPTPHPMTEWLYIGHH